MRILIIFTFLVCYTTAFRQQVLGIRGQLMCGYNENMIDTKTDATGHFEAIGNISSLFHAKPEMKVYYTCDKEFKAFGVILKKVPIYRIQFLRFKISLKYPN
ncbi:hypothetical protein X798_07147 [Onchocerca flexuosa]|uniref:Transthyretin-like family protein n=1 Tax=Onchocerca flexuosa TaxID=387005 RepID=A0A238BKB6_9BILA|nr:hypothetical protein X798_07147 [Onchocerca flexuosa]